MADNMSDELIIRNNPESVVLYTSEDGVLSLDVQIAEETVWLTQQQMTLLFDTSKQNISLHIKNIFREGELDKTSVVKDYLTTASDGKNYRTSFYNLDVIISIGYRVKSKRGTQFRQWANKVLKDYLLRGYSINQRLLHLERQIGNQLMEHKQKINTLEDKVEFFVRTSLPPKEGIFFEGQIFDAYTFTADLVRSAKQRIILFDNYIDDTVLTLLDKRQADVTADIYTKTIDHKLSLDIEKHNQQYAPINVHQFGLSHDRFLIIDESIILVHRLKTLANAGSLLLK